MSYAVVTRGREGAAPYAAALAALGLEVVAMPVTRTEPPADPGALARALAGGGYAAIVCASARAAAALVVAASEIPAPLPEVWAVGRATAGALEAGQIRAVVPEGVRDGATLAAALVAARGVALAGARVLVPRAEEGREEAITCLRAAGAEVVDVTVYRTVRAPADDPALAEGRALLAGDGAAVCVVLAPSQVAALAALVQVPALRLPFAAIGETTAAALRTAGAGTIAVAESPTPAGIARAVRSVYPRPP